jgi:hypothetical protein
VFGWPAESVALAEGGLDVVAYGVSFKQAN